MEKINVQIAIAVAECAECKALMYNAELSWSDVLHIFVRRAQGIADGIGTIIVAWWERSGAGPTGGRRYSGIFGKVPSQIPSHERNTPSGFCCLSAFALPRGLKYILRTGVGAVDIDMKAAHTQVQLRRLSQAKRLDLATLTREYYENRDEYLQLLQDSEWGKTREKWECKKLLTGLTYGVSVPKGVPDFVQRLAVEQAAIRDFDKEANPELIKQFASRPRPLASLQFSLNETGERMVIDMAVKAGKRCGLDVWSFEHDGIVGGTEWRKVLDTLAFEGLDFTEKPVPCNWQELRETLAHEVPHMAWPDTLDPASPGDVETIINDPLARALSSIGKGHANVDHEAFARIVVNHIGMHFLVESEAKETMTVQWWDPARKLWVRAGGGRRLNMHVVDVCRTHARPLENGVRGVAPSLFGNKNFFGPVCEIVKSYLPTASESPPLDGDQTRGLVRFSCGTVLELETGIARPAEPEDRISKSTGYFYQTLEPNMKDMIKNVVDLVTAAWRQKRALDPALIMQLDAVKRKSKLIELLFELVGTWDLTLWLLCQITRSIGALPRFEEFLWLSAVSGNNGKGTLVAILMAVLGAHADGYYGQLDFERHFLGGKFGATGNTPEIAALEGKRMIVVNETPGIKRGELNTGLIKRLLSLDAQIQATAKYKDPTSWTSMLHLIFMANECPKFDKDPALFTRMSYLFLPFEFCEQTTPGNPAQKPIDTTIKETAKAGTYNIELLHWAVCLTPYLMALSGSRKIQPQPQAVIEDTNSHLIAATAAATSSTDRTSVEDLTRTFIADFLEPWSNAKAAQAPSSRPEVDAAFCAYATRQHERGLNAAECLVNSGLLQNHEGNTRFKVMFKGCNIAIYKKNGVVMTLKTPSDASPQP